MRLKTEDNCWVHTSLFAHDEVLVSRGSEDATYIENWKKDMRYRDFSNVKNEYLSIDHSGDLQISEKTISTTKRLK
jgi:hypothetical protein